MSICGFRSIFVTVLCLATACGDNARDDQGTASADSLATTTASTSGPSTSTSGETDSASSDTDKLDVGMFPDMGGGETGPLTCTQAAEQKSNQGCEFWAVDLANAWFDTGVSSPAADQQFAVVVANTSPDQDANVEVFLGAGNTAVAMAMVAPDSVHEFKLAPQNIAPLSNSYDGVAYRIESDIPITAYQFNPLDNTNPVYSNDASLLFPSHVLDTDYTAITGDAIRIATDALGTNSENSGAYVSVVALADATTVTMYPTAPIYPGNVEDVMLDRGQVFTIVSMSSGQSPVPPGDGNLSGTRVEASAPVAVFSGNVATLEPASAGKCCADHMEHQMLPLVAWGNGYLAAPAAASKGGGSDPSVFRVTGGFDGTQLEYLPAAPAGAPTTIDAYQTVAFQTEQPFTVRSTDPDKPFALTQFLLSNQVINAFLYPGDPAMIALPAAEQYQDKYIFLVPMGYTSNFVTVVGQVGADIMLDGVSIAGGNFQALGALDGVDYEYIHLALQPGHHTIESSEPVGIVVTGYSQDVSYGYPGGSGLKGISIPPPPPQG